MYILRDEKGVMKAKLSDGIVSKVLTSGAMFTAVTIGKNRCFKFSESMKFDVGFPEFVTLYIWDGDYIHQEVDTKIF